MGNLMSNTSSMASVQDVLKCLHKHGVQGTSARMEVVNMLDHKQVNTNYWYSPESIVKQLTDTIKIYLTTGVWGEVSKEKKATMSKLKFELNKAEDRVVIYLADEVIGHIFWCNDAYNLCWEAHNAKNPEQQFDTWKFYGHFDLSTLMKKITAVVEAISNGDCKVMSVCENMEPLDMNANRLKTEEQKIHWLENEIKDLEYVLSSDCINRNLKLNQLQMYRELLSIKLYTSRSNDFLAKLEEKELRIKEMQDAAADIGLKWHDYDAGEDAWEDKHTGKWARKFNMRNLMKISKIIEELTELKEYIGDKDLESCVANDTTDGVNVMYLNDEGGWTSTSLEGEKAKAELKATIGDQ